MKQKLWAIIAFLYCFMLGITAQQNNQKQIVVSGVVTDANNEPLIGANVTVKNVPGLGAITNIDGKYIPLRCNPTTAWCSPTSVMRLKRF